MFKKKKKAAAKETPASAVDAVPPPPRSSLVEGHVVDWLKANSFDQTVCDVIGSCSVSELTRFSKATIKGKVGTVDGIRLFYRLRRSVQEQEADHNNGATAQQPQTTVRTPPPLPWESKKHTNQQNHPDDDDDDDDDTMDYRPSTSRSSTINVHDIDDDDHSDDDLRSNQGDGDEFEEHQQLDDDTDEEEDHQTQTHTGKKNRAEPNGRRQQNKKAKSISSLARGFLTKSLTSRSMRSQSLWGLRDAKSVIIANNGIKALTDGVRFKLFKGGSAKTNMAITLMYVPPIQQHESRAITSKGKTRNMRKHTSSAENSDPLLVANEHAAAAWPLGRLYWCLPGQQGHALTTADDQCFNVHEIASLASGHFTRFFPAGNVPAPSRRNRCFSICARTLATRSAPSMSVKVSQTAAASAAPTSDWITLSVEALSDEFCEAVFAGLRMLLESCNAPAIVEDDGSRITLPHNCARFVAPAALISAALHPNLNGDRAATAARQRIAKITAGGASTKATDSSKVTPIAGFLTKLGGVRRNWKRRYVQARDAYLDYYKYDREAVHPFKKAGHIPLLSAVLINLKSHPDRPHCIGIRPDPNARRTFVLEAEDAADRALWEAHIISVLRANVVSAEHKNALVDLKPSSRDVECEGFLLKKGGMLRTSWQSRFFQLSGRSLKYYVRQEQKDSVFTYRQTGELYTFGAALVNAQDQDIDPRPRRDPDQFERSKQEEHSNGFGTPFTFGLRVWDSTKLYILRAKTWEEYSKWVSKLGQKISAASTPQVVSVPEDSEELFDTAGRGHGHRRKHASTTASGGGSGRKVSGRASSGGDRAISVGDSAAAAEYTRLSPDPDCRMRGYLYQRMVRFGHAFYRKRFCVLGSDALHYFSKHTRVHRQGQIYLAVGACIEIEWGMSNKMCVFSIETQHSPDSRGCTLWFFAVRNEALRAAWVNAIQSVVDEASKAREEQQRLMMVPLHENVFTPLSPAEMYAKNEERAETALKLLRQEGIC